jgi:hypothetical protein
VTGLALLWLSGALLAAEPVETHEAGRAVTRILAQDRYLFCAEDNDYQPSPGDRRWCELAAVDGHRRCRGYAQVCAREVPGMDIGDLDGFEFGEGSAEPEDKQPGEANQGARTERDAFELPDLGGFAKILMWGLLLAGLIALVYVVAKNMVRGRDEDEHEPEPGHDPGASLVAERAAVMRAVETDVSRLLGRAEQAATRGEFEAAIADVYAALLRRLEGERLIHVERWKTNGDYLAELRAHGPLHDEVRAILREVEQVQFGAGPAEPSRYQSVYPSVRAKVVAVVSRAALAFAIMFGGMFGGATLFGCPLFEQDHSGEDRPLPRSADLAGLKTGPTDHRAVAELLRYFDIRAEHRTRSIEQLASTDAAIVLLEGVELLAADWDTLITWVEDEGGVLIIATGQEFPRELGVAYAPTDETVELQVVATDHFYQQLEVAAPPGRTLDPERGETILARPSELDLDRATSSPGFDEWGNPQSEGDRPYLVWRRFGSKSQFPDTDETAGQIIVFAEPDLLSNAGISVADNAALLINLLRRYEIDKVEFVDQYTGAGADDPFESMANAKLGALFLQILLFLALLYAAVGIPFARLRAPSRTGRRAFVEHVETLGQRYAQARASRYVAGIYSAWALDRLRERVQPGAARGLLPLAQAIAARTGRDEASLMTILVTAHELRDHSADSRGASAQGRAGDLELMRQLAQLLDEVGGNRR